MSDSSSSSQHSLPASILSGMTSSSPPSSLFMEGEGEGEGGKFRSPRLRRESCAVSCLIGLFFGILGGSIGLIVNGAMNVAESEVVWTWGLGMLIAGIFFVLFSGGILFMLFFRVCTLRMRYNKMKKGWEIRCQGLRAEHEHSKQKTVETEVEEEVVVVEKINKEEREKEATTKIK